MLKKSLPEGLTDLLADLTTRFEDFAKRFATDGKLPYPLALKYDHSRRVADFASRIARDLSWNARAVVLAEAAGLVHDVGRFPQFARFGTFQDLRSLDHGDEGCRVLETENFLTAWPQEEAEMLRSAVHAHNKRIVPPTCPPSHRPLALLLRDADKLDIFSVVQDAIDEGRIGEIVFGLTLEGPPSPELLAHLQHRNGPERYDRLRSLADFLALQLGWVYDIHYAPAFRILEDCQTLRRLVDRLAVHEAACPALRSFIEGALDHVRTKRMPEAPLASATTLPYAHAER